MGNGEKGVENGNGNTNEKLYKEVAQAEMRWLEACRELVYKYIHGKLGAHSNVVHERRSTTINQVSPTFALWYTAVSITLLDSGH